MTQSSQQISQTEAKDILATIQKRIDIIEYLSILSKEDLRFLLDEIEEFQDETNTEKLRNLFYKLKRFEIENRFELDMEQLTTYQQSGVIVQAKLELVFEQDDKLITFRADLINCKWTQKDIDEGNKSLHSNTS
jgi:hypothetical protein